MKKLLVLIFVCGLILAACTPKSETTPQKPGLANPASTNCVDNGGTLEIRTAADGSQAGYCTFKDGSVCEEWAFFRGECKMGDAKP